MELIIGGAFQGKLDYAKETYGLNDVDIYECSETCAIDTDRRAYNHFERYLLYCCRNGLKPVLEFQEGTVVIMDDIFCGVVPAEKDIREWREFCGRAGGELTKNATSVTRIFCGLPQSLKKK